MHDSILIIDDERALALALTTRLKAEGFEVFHALDGLTGLEAAASHRPDMIVLDIRMPGFNGIDVLRHLKSNPDLKDIPVMILSANLDETRRLEATAAGAVACLSKPFDAGEILEVIRAQLVSTAEILRTKGTRHAS